MQRYEEEAELIGREMKSLALDRGLAPKERVLAAEMYYKLRISVMQLHSDLGKHIEPGREQIRIL